VPICAQTGHEQIDAKDVWFIGFFSKLVAGCYNRFRTNPRCWAGALWRVFLCVSGFTHVSCADRAIKLARPLRSAAGGAFSKLTVQRARLFDGASGSNVVPKFYP